MHHVPTTQPGMRLVDPDQVCDAVAVLSEGSELRHAATVLDVLGEPNRLSILIALHHAGDLCVSDLAVSVGMSDSAVSHALRLMRAHGLVTAHRDGRLVRYRVADPLAHQLLEVVSARVVRNRPVHAEGAEHGGE